MAKKEFTYRGKNLNELKALSMAEFAALLPARQRRTIKRGLTEQEKKLLKHINDGKKNIETHCRDMIIFPSMVGMMIKIHNGKSFEQVMIVEDMIGHLLGEFALTRSKVTHSAPGIGATKSSSSISVR